MKLSTLITTCLWGLAFYLSLFVGAWNVAH